MNRNRSAVLGTLAAAVAGLAAFLAVDADGNSSSGVSRDAVVVQQESAAAPQRDRITLPLCILCYL